MTDDTFIGPRKPAFLTVKRERWKRILENENFVSDYDAFHAWRHSVGMTDFAFRDPRNVEGCYTLAFIDDYAAAEFALRYA